MISKEIVEELLDEKAKRELMLILNTVILNPTKISIELLTILEEFLEEERKVLIAELKEEAKQGKKAG